MSLTNNLGRLSAGLTADASLNIGVGVTPSGTYRFEVGTTSKFTGVATFGSTLSNGTYTYTLPNATGTLALTSALSGYLPLTGGTLTGALGGTSASFSDNIQSSSFFRSNTPTTNSITIGVSANTNYGYIGNSNYWGIRTGTAGDFNIDVNNSASPINALKITQTGAATFSGLITGQAGIYQSNAASSIASNKFETYNGGSTALILDAGGSSASIDFRVTGSTKLTIASTGDATFNNSVTAKNALISWSGASSSNLLMRDLSGNNKYEMGWEATTNNFYIYSYGGGLTPFRISPSGNTLLGSPADNSFKLQVLASGAPMMSLGTSSATGGYLEVRYNTSSVNGYLGAGNQLVTGGAVADMALTSNTGNILFATGGGIERVRIGGTANQWDLMVGATSAYQGSAFRGSITINGSAASILTLGVGGTNKGYIYHSGTQMYIENSVSGGNLYVTSGSGGGVTLASGATSWTATSDERLKDINSNIDSAVDKLMTLRTVNFSWKSDSTKKDFLGLIAQDVEKVFPQVIDKSKLPSKPEKEQVDKTEYLGVRYTELIPVLVAAIQEQQQQIKELQSQINK